MKTQTTKKLFTFMLLLSGMFSFTSASAQNNCNPCNGNKVKISLCTGGFYNYCESCKSKCVSSDQVQDYLNKGWGYGNCPNSCGGNGRLQNQSTDETMSLFVYPNPVSSSTSISFSLYETQNVSLKIYDLSGRLINVIAEGVFEEGDYEIEWNASGMMEGIYFLCMETADYSENQKLIVEK